MAPADKADLFGWDMSGADLGKADLTFAWFIKARFDHANLRGATLQTIVTSKAMDDTAKQAVNFVSADLSDSNNTMHFSFDDMHGVSFTHAHMSAVIANQSMGLLRTEFMSCNLDGADFEGAELGHNLFRFAKLRNAKFRSADLSSADFTGAYLDSADFTGAKLDEATSKGASLAGSRGLDQIRSAPANQACAEGTAPLGGVAGTTRPRDDLWRKNAAR